MKLLTKEEAQKRLNSAKEIHVIANYIRLGLVHGLGTVAIPISNVVNKPLKDETVRQLIKAGWTWQWVKVYTCEFHRHNFNSQRTVHRINWNLRIIIETSLNPPGELPDKDEYSNQ